MVESYLFGFETLVFATSGILSMHKQLLNTPKRIGKLKLYNLPLKTNMTSKLSHLTLLNMSLILQKKYIVVHIFLYNSITYEFTFQL